MNVFHQTGFRDNWNRDILEDESIGDGLILSPVNIPKKKLDNLKKATKEKSLFDPQLYVLDKELKKNLMTYDYHPKSICDDSINTQVINKNSEIIAKNCITLQLKNNFKYLVIPTQRYENLNYIDNYFKLKLNYVEPFLNHAKNENIDKPIFLTVIVSENILLDTDKMNYLLNWITSFPSLDGVYLIFENDYDTKQIENSSFLLNALKFIDTLKENELSVIIGYCNIEGLLYSIAMPDGISMGSYENLRSFSIKRYLDEEKTPMRAPKPRLYSNKLLSWITFGDIESIESLATKKIEDYFDDNQYRTLVFHENFNWHFAKPELYKHYFISYYNQAKNLPESQDERIEYIENMVSNAKKEYRSLTNNGIILGDSNGVHLNAWKKAIEGYKKYLDEEKI